LYEAIGALDPTGAYKEISYDLTANNALLQSAPWWVFVPYGQWANPLSPPNPSPFEAAVLQAIPSAKTDVCFIDILSLGTHEVFFDDPQVSKTIAAALTSYINGLDPSVKPLIRYLEGNPFVQKPNPAGCGIIQALFDGQITNPNAGFYYGSFSPDFQPSASRAASSLNNIWQLIEAAIEKIWQWIVTQVQQYSQALYQALMAIDGEIVGWIRRFVAALPTSPVSWNHAKIFAVNGTSLVAGGANYWTGYSTGQSWLFDLSMSVTGDATISAHKFANYFWQYLNQIPSTDKSSWNLFKHLNDQNGDFTFKTAPLFTDFPVNTGSLSLLAVGKNGNWPTPVPGYPAVIFDAIRDFTLNVVSAVAQAKVSRQMDWTALVANILSDDSPTFRNLLSDVLINPAAWASRYARNHALSQARVSARLSQQKLVMDDLFNSNQEFKNLVQDINNYVGSNWDGYMWPFDTLMAFGTALAAMSNNPAPTGIQLVTSCPTDANGGYEDPVSLADFTAKLAGVMNAMQALGYIHPSGSVQTVIESLLQYKRIDNSTTNPAHGNHSKLVMVDDTVCYVGSDNAYPSYSQEFGIWLDDPSSIDALLSQFWTGLWSFAQPAT
jgi:hypothetical protein